MVFQHIPENYDNIELLSNNSPLDLEYRITDTLKRVVNNPKKCSHFSFSFLFFLNKLNDLQYKRYERELEIQIYQFWNLSKYILKKSVVKIFFSLILTKVILTVTLDPTLPTFSYSLLFKLYIYIETHTDASDLRHI